MFTKFNVSKKLLSIIDLFFSLFSGLTASCCFPCFVGQTNELHRPGQDGIMRYVLPCVCPMAANIRQRKAIRREYLIEVSTCKILDITSHVNFVFFQIFFFLAFLFALFRSHFFVCIFSFALFHSHFLVRTFVSCTNFRAFLFFREVCSLT